MSRQRPSDAGVLVRERHGSDVLVAPIKQPLKPPIRGVGPAFGNPHHRTRPVDQQRAQVNVPALADPKECFLAAARVLPGHEPEEGGELVNADFLCPIFADLKCPICAGVRCQPKRCGRRRQSA